MVNNWSQRKIALSYWLEKVGLKYFKAWIWRSVINEENAEAQPKVAKIQLASRSVIERSSFFSKEALGRLDRGDLCFIAIVDNMIVGCLWCTLGGKAYVTEFEREIRLRDNEAYIYNVYVLPAFRGRRLSKSLVQGFMREAKARKVKRAYTIILTANVAAQAAFKGYGFRPVKMIKFLKIFSSKRFEQRDLNFGMSHRNES